MWPTHLVLNHRRGQAPWAETAGLLPGRQPPGSQEAGAEALGSRGHAPPLQAWPPTHPPCLREALLG